MSFINGLKTIVVATDLHGQADQAVLEYASKLAAVYGARIVLAHGIDPLDYAVVDGVPGRVLEDLSQKARGVLEQLKEDLLQDGIHSHSEIRQGAVAEMLVDVARQYEAGLIIIGTEGRDGAGPVVVGAIAEQLVRIAPCPVLAVAADWNSGPHRPKPGGPVLLAIEGNEAAAAAVAAAWSLADTFSRSLILLHVRTPAEVTAFLNPRSTRLEGYGIRPTRGILVQELVKDGNTADAVVETIDQHHPCMLVVGVKRHSATPGPHGTAFALMALSRVPVLCVPPEAPVARERELALAMKA